MASKSPPEFATTICDEWDEFAGAYLKSNQNGKERYKLQDVFYAGALAGLMMATKLECSELSDEAVDAIHEGLNAEILMHFNRCKCPSCMTKRGEV